MLDKGVDFAQERFLGAGAQNNESAIEQAKVRLSLRSEFHHL